MDTSFYQTMSTAELELRVQLLRTLCDEVDPYASLDKKVIKQLKELSIKTLDNPFTLTNQLLLLMENALEELGSRSHCPLQ